MGISAYHILRKQRLDIFLKSFRIGLVFAVISSLFVVAEGHMHASDLADKQPAKLAALESLWVTQKIAPIFVITLPYLDNTGNVIEIGRVPGAMSVLAYHTPSALVRGLNDIPKDERPPVLATFISFRIMVSLGMLFVLLTVLGWFLRKRLELYPLYLKVMLYAIPLPYITCALGWTVTEVGRQPWIVYGLMKTGQAASSVEASQVVVSLLAFVLVYAAIGLLGFRLMAETARKGPTD